jgi:hypothetical protein
VPQHQVLVGIGRNKEVRHWLVGADHPPALGVYNIGSATLHIKAVIAKNEPPHAAKGKGQKGDKKRSLSRGLRRPSAPPPGSSREPARTLPKVQLFAGEESPRALSAEPPLRVVEGTPAGRDAQGMPVPTTPSSPIDWLSQPSPKGGLSQPQAGKATPSRSTTPTLASDLVPTTPPGAAIFDNSILSMENAELRKQVSALTAQMSEMALGQKAMQSNFERLFEGLTKVDWKLTKQAQEELDQAAGKASSSQGIDPYKENVQTSPATPSSAETDPVFRAENEANAEAERTRIFNLDVEKHMALNASPASPTSPAPVGSPPTVAALLGPGSWPSPAEAAGAEKRVLSRNRSLGDQVPNPKHIRGSSDTS